MHAEVLKARQYIEPLTPTGAIKEKRLATGGSRSPALDPVLHEAVPHPLHFVVPEVQ
jgi:hypothetical protein